MALVQQLHFRKTKRERERGREREARRREKEGKRRIKETLNGMAFEFGN